MENKYKLQKGILFGVLIASTLFCSSCEKKKEESTLFDNMGMNDLWSNMSNSNSQSTAIIEDKSKIIKPIEPVELNNGQVGYKVPVNYVPYQVDQEYSMPGMIEVTEVTDEYKILTMPYHLEGKEKVDYTLDGAIGVYEPCVHLLISKRFIFSKYGLSEEDEIADYSFASLDDQELLKKIDQLEKMITSSYEETKTLKLTR